MSVSCKLSLLLLDKHDVEVTDDYIFLILEHVAEAFDVDPIHSKRAEVDCFSLDFADHVVGETSYERLHEHLTFIVALIPVLRVMLRNQLGQLLSAD